MTKYGRSDEWFETKFMAGDHLADNLVKTIAQSDSQLLSEMLRSIIQYETIEKLIEKAPFYSKLTKQHTKIVSGLQTYLVEAEKGVFEKAKPLADRDLIQTGQRVFSENGMMAFAILGCASLPESYATAYGARVLGITTGLTENVKRRLWETSLFVMNVMKPVTENAEGAATDGGKLGMSSDGIMAAKTVRLLHALVRELINTPPKKSGSKIGSDSGLDEALLKLSWQRDAWGEPVNQLSMSMAILSFSYVVLRSLRKLGVELTRLEERAYLHCWNVIGKIMGVDEDLLLPFKSESMEEAQDLYERIWLRPGVVVRTEEGRKLERALLDYMEDFVPETFAPLRRIPRILTRELVSSKIAGAIGLRLDWIDAIGVQILRGLTHTQRFATGVAGIAGVDLDWAGTTFQDLLKAGGLRHLREDDLDQLPPIRLAAEWLFRQMAEGLNNQRDRGGDRSVFQIPRELDKHWHIGDGGKE